jgi:hypothetical protein
MSGWGDDLNMLQAVSPCAVIRVSSGIKLLQGGLELANVGIISAYTPDAGNNALLANALANEKTIFETVAHPILDCGCGVAPFCVLSLKDKSRQANARWSNQSKNTRGGDKYSSSREEVSGLGATGSKWCSPMTRLRRFCALQ